VQYKPFLNMSKTFDQVADVMKICPAIRVDEYKELAQKDSAPFTDQELQAGILQGISALSGNREIEDPKRFVEAVEKVEEFIRPKYDPKVSWSDVTDDAEENVESKKRADGKTLDPTMIASTSKGKEKMEEEEAETKPSKSSMETSTDEAARQSSEEENFGMLQEMSLKTTLAGGVEELGPLEEALEAIFADPSLAVDQ
jgi:hypothetical protein